MSTVPPVPRRRGRLRLAVVKTVEMGLVDPVEINRPLRILIPLNHGMIIDRYRLQKIFQFAENYSESDLKNAQLMADDDVVTGFFEANLSTFQPFFRSFPQQWICAVVDRDDKETIVVPETRLVYCKRFKLLAIADENSLPELIESYIQQGLISVKNAYPVMRRFDTSLPGVTITGGMKSQLSAGDYSEVIVGDEGTATAGDGGTATAGWHGTATAGDWGTATAGDGGTATAGDGGTATAGDGGTATAGDWGTATAGDGGTATAGDQGTATVGDEGTATAGWYGTATAGDQGTATAGDQGTATAGNQGTATAGNHGTATAGNHGTATAGDH
ncbi:hypothetical protein, partial [Aquaspirillum serpens]|uniref:hypothetical protein n=1 Tax=Aquaspirillum serpens TaxID=190 RepID=UPI001B7FC162